MAVLAVAATALLAGCGSDDSDGGSGAKDAKTTTSDAADAAPAPTLDDVMACMQEAGLDAEDQSDSTSERIGVDLDGGRMLVYFEKSADDAKMTEDVAGSQDPDAKVVRKGTVVISGVADQDEAVDTAEGCIE